MIKHVIKAAIAVVCLWLSAASAFAKECKMDVDVRVRADNGTWVERAKTDNFRYGQEFELRMVGTYPGTYCVRSLAPDRSTIDFDPIFATGNETIRLPCARDGSCNTADPWPYSFVDDGDSIPSGQFSEEMLLVRYFPCIPEDEALKQATNATQEYAAYIPACSTAPKTCPEGSAILLQFESIQEGRSRTKGCTPDENSGGQAMLYKSFYFKVFKD